MKKLCKKTFLTVVIAAAMVFIMAVSVYTYDSKGDPIVTLSYLNEVFFQQIKQEISQAVSGLSGQNGVDGNLGNNSRINNSYEVVELEGGMTLLASEGSMEIILRPGGGVVCVSENDMGLSDITGGTDIFNGQELIANHYVVIPRADGRGVRAVGETAYLLVRGGYVIE